MTKYMSVSYIVGRFYYYSGSETCCLQQLICYCVLTIVGLYIHSQQPQGKREEDLSIDWNIIVEQNFQKSGGRVWAGVIWLRMGTSKKLLRTLQCTIGFNKMWENLWPAEECQLLKEKHCSTSLVSQSFSYFIVWLVGCLVICLFVYVCIYFHIYLLFQYWITV